MDVFVTETMDYVGWPIAHGVIESEAEADEFGRDDAVVDVTARLRVGRWACIAGSRLGGRSLDVVGLVWEQKLQGCWFVTGRHVVAVSSVLSLSGDHRGCDGAIEIDLRVVRRNVYLLLSDRPHVDTGDTLIGLLKTVVDCSSKVQIGSHSSST